MAASTRATADDFVHGPDARQRKAAAGLAQLLGEGGNELMRVAVGADDPAHGNDAGVERGDGVDDLGLGNDHHRSRIAIEAAVVDVANDADDLAGGLFELRANAPADDDLLADGVIFGPEFVGHGLVDEDHTGSAAIVIVGKVAAAQDGDFEHAEIAR
jgi:hypothetical protein